MNIASRGQPLEELVGPLNDLERLHAPDAVFVAGHARWLRTVPRIAVVGSRQASDDALRCAADVARHLVERDALVVSGLAAGVDRAVHAATIEAQGRTAAILGTPLSECFPRSNAALQRHLMQHGVVVSQFEDGRPAGQGSFPRRNRTMALVTHATIVIEATERSGTRHQAWEAVRLGRPVLLAHTLLERGVSWAYEILDYGAIVFDSIDGLSSALESCVPSVATDDVVVV